MRQNLDACDNGFSISAGIGTFFNQVAQLGETHRAEVLALQREREKELRELRERHAADLERMAGQLAAADREHAAEIRRHQDRSVFVVGREMLTVPLQ